MPGSSSSSSSLNGGDVYVVSSRGGSSAPLLGGASPSTTQGINRAWYLLHLIPLFALLPQAWLTFNKLSTTESGFLANFNSKAVATSMAAFGVISPVVFAQWSIFRFLRLLKLDSPTVRAQLRPWKAASLVPAAFVSMMFTTEAFQDGVLADIAQDAPYFMYFCMAMAASSSVLTNTINLFMKPDESKRFDRLERLEHAAFDAGNDQSYATQLREDFNVNTGTRLIKTLLEEPEPGVVAMVGRYKRQDSQAPIRNKCFSESYAAWASFSFIAFFQFGLAGMKAYNCLSSGFKMAECTKAITLDAYLEPKHYGYGFAWLMGLESTIVNAYIWRRTCSDARKANHYSNKSSIALASVMLVFSVVFTFAQISANKPLKNQSLDNAIALAVPLFSAGLTFLSFLLLCDAARKLLPWTCAQKTEDQQSVQSSFSDLFKEIKADPSLLDAKKLNAAELAA